MIEIQNLTKKASDKVIIDNVSFVAEGVTGICCEDNLTRSTLLAIIAGTVPATEGSILLNGENLPCEALARSKAISYLLDGAPVFNEMTPYEFLFFIGKAKKIEEERLHRQIEEVLELTLLSDVKDVYLEHLSTSERKKVAIAQALLGNPKAIVLNDPFEGLCANDRSIMKSIIEMLGEIKTVIISSKESDDIADICDRVTIISNGTLESFNFDAKIAADFTAQAIAEVVKAEESSTEDINEKEGE